MQEYIFEAKNIYYRKNDFKSGRPTLIFIHGISGSCSAWFPYEEKFENNYNVLTFDLRGHGKSIKYRNCDDYALPKFAEDFFELITFLKIEKFILISHSFGVLVAFEFIAKHLDMLDKIVFLSPNFSPGKIFSAKILKPLLGLTSMLNFLPFCADPHKHIDYNKYPNSGDWNIPRMIADISNTGLRAYLFGTKQSYGVDYENLLDKINIPTLILHGEKDSIFPIASARAMHKKIKNSQFVEIKNSNHILVLNNFNEVSGAIVHFVAPLSSSVF